MTTETIDLEDGKYTLCLHSDGRLEALRYGEPWRELCGDKLVLCLMQRVQALESKVEDLHNELLEDNCRD